MKTLRILGTRGVPAAHGGFETFAEHLALHLVDQGWTVVVYCQEVGPTKVVEDQWRGVDRVRIFGKRTDALASIIFDWKATRHAAGCGDLCLTLGYNTAIFSVWLRWSGVPNVINMDGIEWHRAKWGRVAKMWFWINEWAGCHLGNHLVADHPEIARHLSRHVPESRITVIPYGADALTSASEDTVRKFGLRPGGYLTLIARPEPENSVLEVVRGFSRRPRGMQLAVLGAFREDQAYHRDVLAAASDEVCFLGAIYDKPVVQALRRHSLAYVHGHQVGGTNPSLVEALGAGNAILAHDNRFNRWVAGDAARYFAGADGFSDLADSLSTDAIGLANMRGAAVLRHHECFEWTTVLSAYEMLLMSFLPARALRGQPS